MDFLRRLQKLAEIKFFARSILINNEVSYLSSWGNVHVVNIVEDWLSMECRKNMRTSILHLKSFNTLNLRYYRIWCQKALKLKIRCIPYNEFIIWAKAKSEALKYIWRFFLCKKYAKRFKFFVVKIRFEIRVVESFGLIYKRIYVYANKKSIFVSDLCFGLTFLFFCCAQFAGLANYLLPKKNLIN